MNVEPASLEYLRYLASVEDPSDMPQAAACLTWAAAEIEQLREQNMQLDNMVTDWGNRIDDWREITGHETPNDCKAEIERLEDACAYAAKCLAANHALCFPNDDRIIVLEEASKRACARRNQPTQGE